MSGQERLRTEIAKAIQRGEGNEWLAADNVLKLIKPIVVQARTAERERIIAALSEVIRSAVALYSLDPADDPVLPDDFATELLTHNQTASGR